MKKYLEDPTLGLVRTKRPAQIRMYEAVIDTFAQGGIAAIQAGTGTGKSYAYLLGALSSIRSGTVNRVVVATAKKTLQSQLFRKDLPAVNDRVEEFDYATLKGKANYLCKLRYNEYIDSGGTGSHQEFDFPHFAKWAEDDPIGDLSAFDRDVPFAWHVRVTECVREHCPHLPECGYYRNRLNAKDAEVLVVNHSLLALDFQLGRGKVLGEYDAVVIDEAHQFAEFATKAYSFELYAQQAEQFERSLQGDQRIKLPDAMKAKYERLFSLLGKSESGPFPKNPQVEAALLGVLDSLQELKARLQNNGITVDALASLEDAVGLSGPSDVSDVASARRKGKLTSVASSVDKAVRGITTILDDKEDYLPLVERRDFRELPRVTVTPLDVGPLLGPSLKACERVVLTSATLKTTDGFGYLCRGLGLSVRDLTTQLNLDSPFDFKSRTGLWVSPTALMPDHRNKDAVIRQQIKEIDELLVESKGGAFILCASREDMRSIASELLLKKRMEYNVLTQSDNVDKDIARFGSGYQNVLVGVKSIWEGVDVPGMRLRLVIIPRLPFPNKNDHLHNAKKDLAKARMVAGGADPDKAGYVLFNDYDVQRVAIEIAQGSGRLVRTENDFGLLVFLDPRMHPGSKPYTNGFRNLLPHKPFYKREEISKLLGIFRNLAEKEEAAKNH